MAFLIETADKEWQDEHNEYYKDYMEHIFEHDKERFNKYMTRAKELSEAGEQNIMLALAEISRHFHSIWD